MSETEQRLSKEQLAKLGLEGHVPVGEPVDFDSKEAAEKLRGHGLAAARSVKSYELITKGGKKAVINIFMKAGQEGISVDAYLGAQGATNNVGIPESYARKMAFEPVPPPMPEGKRLEDLTLEEKQQMGTQVLGDIISLVDQELDKE